MLTYERKNTIITITEAVPSNAPALSHLRHQLDGETENFDREQGEAFLDPTAFRALIEQDHQSPHNLCLVATIDEQIVGYARCQGSNLARLQHRVEFGMGVLEAYWGLGIGKQLLLSCISWAKAQRLHKMTLTVLATNEPAISLYHHLGFQQEGCLVDDKYHRDGRYYDTLLMGLFLKSVGE
ncbi:acetyltransferase [Fictibacillus macauensis ZFHKF-1]|uniref:Acetyltransferase n=1 Tax=Fictibacillus macauensis ZFHKF-1 TaxID=1196324 RepID=I8IY10_9BACL|nr:GNAT family N-acetyltransferase [Fictibacillus macauensis]EIT84376.1 acetyltransferase [Fictibacillus macauensis ZFHKF-1]